jgi:small subunit ribosomal protein S7
VAGSVYNSTLVNKFVNSMMWDGKKSTASASSTRDENLAKKSGDEALKPSRRP